MLGFFFSKKVVPVLDDAGLSRLRPARLLVEGHAPVLWQPSQTILSALEAASIPVRRSCRNGNCGACMATLLVGEVGYRVVQPSYEPEKGCFLMCASVPLTDVKLSLLPSAMKRKPM